MLIEIVMIRYTNKCKFFLFIFFCYGAK